MKEGICEEQAAREQVSLHLHYVRSKRWDTAILKSCLYLGDLFIFFLCVYYISGHRSMCHIGSTSSGHKHRSSPHAAQVVGKLMGKKEKLEFLLVTCPFCFSLFFLCVPVPFSPLTHNKILCCVALACLYF